MKIAIMQPYIFPYIGYWQLINLVDTFVILDDVNYIMRGYINRNSVLLNGKVHKFTIPIKQASQNKLIKDTRINFEPKEKQRLEMMLKNAYGKAPFYGEAMPVIKDIIYYDEDDLTDYICHSIKGITKYLGISTNIIYSSKIEKNTELRGQERIIEICKKLNAKQYINPCGGKILYNQKDFQKENISLNFLEAKLGDIRYSQGKKEFIEGLSIIDIMMFNSVDEIRNMLDKYELSE